MLSMYHAILPLNHASICRCHLSWDQMVLIYRRGWKAECALYSAKPSWLRDHKKLPRRLTAGGRIVPSFLHYPTLYSFEHECCDHLCTWLWTCTDLPHTASQYCCLISCPHPMFTLLHNSALCEFRTLKLMYFTVMWVFPVIMTGGWRKRYLISTNSIVHF